MVTPEGSGNENNYPYVDIPQDERKLGTIVSYMGWHQITAASPQLTLKNDANTNGRYSIGTKPKYYAMIDGRMLIATKENIGGLLEVSIGDYLDVLFEASDGTKTTYKCIAGDVKEAGAESSSWGHYNGQGVVEIIYHSYTPPTGYDSVNNPESAGNNPWGKGKVLKITIVGNYYDN